MARRAWLIPLLLALAGGAAVRAAEEPVLFETHVLPLLQTRCIRCHGEKKKEGGLDLRRKFTILQGGDSGPAIVPGQPGRSLLLGRVEKGEMPPVKGETLDRRQVEMLTRWVTQGARLEAASEPPLEDREEVGRVAEEDRGFWAFQPPRRPEVPRVKAMDRVRTPVDAFLLARLEERGLGFSPDAPREVLLRRLCFDLLGLPPTPAQREAFLGDQRPDAYERLVDRLLASPHYGERWGRHWLDVAGYADSDGYLAADRLRPEAWRYRDYVIGAHNDDLPYDQFVREQLAGDELSDWRRAEKLTPEMVRQLTATGFLRTALDPTYPGYTEPNEIHQVLADTMQILGSTFLGMTLQCARCHAHKSDPISQRDYYAMRAVLLPALDTARWQPSGVRGIPLAPEAEQTQIRAHNDRVAARVKALTGELAALTQSYQKKHEADRGAKKVSDADLAKLYPDYQEKADRLKKEIAAEQARKRDVVLVRGLMDLDGKPVQGHVLVRGEYDKPGAGVAPDAPEVLTPPGFRLKPEPGYRTTGQRLALARWLTDRGNPLTARVQVNRMWRQHFGRGIVATPANFGRSGARPTHPELLDWLACEFMDGGWSMKAMHRLMVTSTAYRQASGWDARRAAADPGNDLLSAWRPRRHEGEVVRDSILAVAGLLNEARFGPPVPVAPRGDGSVETRDDAEGRRRSIYLIVRRSQHVTLLDLFDTPLMEVSCPERPVSTVPLQALALLHGPLPERGAAALAERILREAAPDDGSRLTLVCQLVYGRDPRPAEREKVLRFLGALYADGRTEAAVRAAWTQAALVLLNSSEFLYVH